MRPSSKGIITDAPTSTPASGASGVFFIHDQLLFTTEGNQFIFALEQTIKILQLQVHDHHIDGEHTIVLCNQSIANEQLRASGFCLLDFKKALLRVSVAARYLLLKNIHWFNWNNRSKYCGQCGERLTVNPHAPEKHCTRCDRLFFPRFSPAVMVLVYRNDELLLARSPHFPPGDYSAIAGFIEIGETAEQAAHREVKEELGITINNLTYFSTQTWPFPDSFMIAFKARYAGGEVVIDTTELEDARWFHRDKLPTLTPSISIARQLIHDFVQSGGSPA